MPSSMPIGVSIVANATDIERLRGSEAASQLGDLALVALSPDAPLPDGLATSASLLVLEVDPDDAASLRRISEVRSRHPNIPIIAALRDADVSLVRTLIRQGIADVTQLPFDAKDLAGQILEAAATQASKTAPAKLAPMVTVAGSMGGCGATTIITHLAASLAKKGLGKRGVCVVDLDMQSGEVSYYVGQQPKVTVTALLDAGDRLDAELMHSAVTDSKHGFSVIAAPETITPLDEVNDDRLLKLLSFIRREFDFVIVDLPDAWTSWTLSVVMASTEVVLVTQLSVASMRQAKRRLELFASIGLPVKRIKLVANRVERKLFRSIGLSEVRDVLSHDVVVALAEENDAMSSAQNEGHLITDVQHHCKFAADIESLAQLLIPEGR